MLLKKTALWPVKVSLTHARLNPSSAVAPQFLWTVTAFLSLQHGCAVMAQVQVWKCQDFTLVSSEFHVRNQLYDQRVLSPRSKNPSLWCISPFSCLALCFAELVQSHTLLPVCVYTP